MFLKHAKSVRPLSLLQTPPKGQKLASVSILTDPERYFYLENWAFSSLEKHGPNDNADGFEDAELRKAYRTFIGSMVCLDHLNMHQSLAIGENIDAMYNPELGYVKLVKAVDKEKSEQRHPGLQASIDEGLITDTSMGAWCMRSVCSICENEAENLYDYCDHITLYRGAMVCSRETGWINKLAFEINRGVTFFEDTIITDAEGADQNAKILAKLASRSPRNLDPGAVMLAIDQTIKEAKTDAERVILTKFLCSLEENLAGTLR